MNEQPKEHRLLNNPFIIVTLVCILALIMSLISFLVYYNSDTRLTVEQLQRNSAELEQKAANNTVNSSELSSDYIDSVQQQINDIVSSHDNSKDFSSTELTDSALGL